LRSRAADSATARNREKGSSGLRAGGTVLTILPCLGHPGQCCSGTVNVVDALNYDTLHHNPPHWRNRLNLRAAGTLLVEGHDGRLLAVP
jgi:hypothetical protein